MEMKSAGEVALRAGGYARFSSDMSRQASIEDQFRQCRRGAATGGWIVLEDYFRADEGISGASLIDREGLDSLIKDAQRKPRPYDVLMIDDTSRLGRNLTLVLQIVEELNHYGVFVFFVSQGFDSRNPNFRQLLIMHGMIDEQYLAGLASKVHRGQEGRFLKGQVPGGKCFGYKNVPIEDPTRKGEYGRPAVIGVLAEKIPSEVETILRIFRMYGEENLSLITIAKRLNADGTPRPEPREDHPDPSWSPSTVHCILHNERYRGVVRWNQTKRVLEPKTYRRVVEKRPENEWLIREDEALRIVSDELWQKVQVRLKYVNEKYGVPKTSGETERKVIGASTLGGLNRTNKSANYLLSGSMVCGFPKPDGSICGGPIITIGGLGPNLRYGCRNHRFKGTCDNSLTITRVELENQFLGALVSRFLQPEMVDLAIKEFNEQLRGKNLQRDQDRQRAGASKRPLQKELQTVQHQLQNLVKAIAQLGLDSDPAFESQVRQLSSRRDTIATQLAVPAEPLTMVAPKDLRPYVLAKMEDLRGLLLGDRPAAKQAIQRFIGKLTLTPVQGPDGPVYSVNGSIRPFTDHKNVMALAAPQGFEPRYADPESAVLPLNEGATATAT